MDTCHQGTGFVVREADVNNGDDGAVMRLMDKMGVATSGGGII